MAKPAQSDFVIIARIQKVRGRRGEVAAELWTDFPERLRPGQQLRAVGRDHPQTLFLEGSWLHKGRAILKFRGFDTISAAETLVGLTLEIPRSDRRSLPPDAVYVSDLIGCAVLEQGQKLGTVVAWEETGGVPLLRVKAPEGEILIPFAQEICGAVDMERKEIRARLPEGLKELNWAEHFRQGRKRAGEPGRLPRR